MSLSALTQQEVEIVLRCLRAAVEGPFFPDWEFHSLFGLNRREVSNIVANWPNIDESNSEVQRAIHNSMGNLVGYPHEEPEAFRQYVGVPYEEVERIFAKWRDSNERRP